MPAISCRRGCWRVRSCPADCHLFHYPIPIVLIARILIPILLLIVLPDVYLELRHAARPGRYTWALRLLKLVPGVAMIVWTIVLAAGPNFIPDDIAIVNTYLFVLGAVFVPKALYVGCVALGRRWQRRRTGRRNWGRFVGAALVAGCWYMLVYGSFWGVRQFEVRQVDLAFDDLPQAFDGYRILHFTDAHLGSFTGSRATTLHRMLDTIGALRPDLIAFTGDLQNMRPQELAPFEEPLRSLRARDGVVAVLGNHDYSEYTNESPEIEAANCRETICRQRQWGWQLLLNENTVVRRGADSIVVAGEENLEHPDKARFDRAMKGVGQGAFVLMLQHNPKAWEQYIRRTGRVQLTLSGHTHGGQVSLFGLRPTMLSNKHDLGLYRQGGSALYVSAGIGSLIPFRFGVPPEIVVITLHKSKQ